MLPLAQAEGNIPFDKMMLKILTKYKGKALTANLIISLDKESTDEAFLFFNFFDKL